MKKQPSGERRMRKKYYYIINDNLLKILKKYDLQPENENITALYSDAEYWEAIKSDFQSSNIDFLRVELEFTEAELAESSWLSMRSTWHWEYPQPKSRFKEFTYGNGNFCNTCGAIFTQQGMFKTRKAPSWRKSHFLQLNWVDDELFVKQETYDLLIKENFKQLDCLPVVHGKENETLDNIVQLKIDSMLEPGLMNDDTIEHICKTCNSKKHFMRGENKMVFKENIFRNVSGDIYKTSERFGSPDLHVAARIIVISNKLYSFIRNMQLDARLEFQPIDCI